MFTFTFLALCFGDVDNTPGDCGTCEDDKTQCGQRREGKLFCGMCEMVPEPEYNYKDTCDMSNLVPVPSGCAKCTLSDNTVCCGDNICMPPDNCSVEDWPCNSICVERKTIPTMIPTPAATCMLDGDTAAPGPDGCVCTWPVWDPCGPGCSDKSSRWQICNPGQFCGLDGCMDKPSHLIFDCPEVGPAPKNGCTCEWNEEGTDCGPGCYQPGPHHEETCKAGQWCIQGCSKSHGADFAAIARSVALAFEK